MSKVLKCDSCNGEDPYYKHVDVQIKTYRYDPTNAALFHDWVEVDLCGDCFKGLKTIAERKEKV